MDWIVFTVGWGLLIAGAIAGVVGAGLNYFVYKKSKQTPITVKTLQPVLPAPVAPPWLFLIEEQKTMLQMAVQSNSSLAATAHFHGQQNDLYRRHLVQKINHSQALLMATKK